MGVAINVAGTKDETPAELEGVLASSMLAVAGDPGPLPGHGVVATQEMEQRGGFEAGCTIRLPLLVDQQGKADAGFLAEEPGIVPVTQADCGETRSFFPKGLLMLAQLRDVLSTEHSAIMAEENEDRTPVRPQRAKLDLLASRVRQNDPRKFSAE